MKYKALIIFIIFLLPLCMFLSSNKILPIIASEEENIDSFNVNPVNRWDQELTTGDETLTVDNGIFTFTDTGDSSESTGYSRLLQDNDFKVEGRVKTPSLTQGPTNFSNLADTDFDTDFDALPVPFGNTTGGSTDYADANGVTWSAYGDFKIIDSTVTEPGHPREYLVTNTGWLNNTLRGFLVTGLTSYSDYDCNLTFFNNNRFAGDLQVGIVYRFTDEGAYYTWISIICDIPDNGGAGYITVYETNATGYPLPISKNAYVFPAEEVALTLRAELINFNLTVWIDSVEQFEISNVTLMEGKAGIRFREDNLRANFMSISIDTSVSSNPQARAMLGLENFDNVLNLSQPGTSIVMECSLDDELDNTVQVYYSFYSGTTNYEVFMFNLTRSTWYRFEIKLNALKSELDFDFETDAGESITNATKSHLQINAAHQPNIFNAFEYKLFWGNNFTQGSQTFSWQLDFLKAPYHEARWKHTASSNLGRAKSVNHFGGVYEEIGVETNDYDIFELVVPSFDSISGIMYAQANVTNEADLDETDCYVALIIKGIYANNGSEKDICFLAFGFIHRDEVGNNDPTYADARVRLGDLQLPATIRGGPYDIIRDFGSYKQVVEIGFTVYRQSINNLTIQIAISGETFDWEYDMKGLSTEVILEVEYEIDEDFTDAVNKFQIGLKDVQLQERAALSSFIPKLPSFSDAIGGITEFFLLPLKVLIRFLATVITAGTTIVFGGLEELLEPLDLLFDAIGGLASSIWTAIIDELENILPEILNVLLTVVSTISTIITALAVWIWNNTVETHFPGIGKLLKDGLNGIFVLINWTTTLFTLAVQFQFFFFLILTTFIFIGAAVISRDLLDFVLNVGNTLAINIAAGFSLLGFRALIPLGAVWFILLIFWWSA